MSRSGLEVEMVLRGVSPLGASLKRARADYENIARGPFGQWDPPLDRDRYHIAGDETGIPAAVQVIQAMEEVVRSFAMLPAKGYVWVALELGVMRSIRDNLINKGECLTSRW